MLKQQVVIIGAGPAGISAAIWSSRLGLSTLVLDRQDKVGGQMEYIQNKIIDYPGYPSITGRELQRKFYEHLNVTTAKLQLQTEVFKIDAKHNKLLTSEGEVLYQFLIVATGAKEKQLHVAGEHLLASQKFSASRDKDLFCGKQVVVIGGGDRACEGACLLADAGADVILIHRSDQFRARDEFLKRVKQHPNIQVRTFVAVKQILGDDKPEGLELYDVYNHNRREFIHTEGIFVRIGTQPNSTLLQGIVSINEIGYCTVDEFGQTQLPNIFSVGDLQVQSHTSSIVVAAAQGMIAAKRISMYIEEENKRV